MTKTEETYAAWLNLLGSDPLAPGPVADEVNIMRIVATSTGDIERFSQAYMDVLLTMASHVGGGVAKELTDALVTSARAHRVQHITGLPLMIDGVDCSPDNVRLLMRSRDEYRAMYLGADVTR